MALGCTREVSIFRGQELLGMVTLLPRPLDSYILPSALDAKNRVCNVKFEDILRKVNIPFGSSDPTAGAR